MAKIRISVHYSVNYVRCDASYLSQFLTFRLDMNKMMVYQVNRHDYVKMSYCALGIMIIYCDDVVTNTLRLVFDLFDPFKE